MDHFEIAEWALIDLMKIIKKHVKKEDVDKFLSSPVLAAMIKGKYDTKLIEHEYYKLLEREHGVVVPRAYRMPDGKNGLKHTGVTGASK